MSYKTHKRKIRQAWGRFDELVPRPIHYRDLHGKRARKLKKWLNIGQRWSANCLRRFGRVPAS
jgi:hypothetical protein